MFPTAAVATPYLKLLHELLLLHLVQVADLGELPGHVLEVVPADGAVLVDVHHPVVGAHLLQPDRRRSLSRRVRSGQVRSGQVRSGQ